MLLHLPRVGRLWILEVRLCASAALQSMQRKAGIVYILQLVTVKHEQHDGGRFLLSAARRGMGVERSRRFRRQQERVLYRQVFSLAVSANVVI